MAQVTERSETNAQSTSPTDSTLEIVQLSTEELALIGGGAYTDDGRTL